VVVLVFSFVTPIVTASNSKHFHMGGTMQSTVYYDDGTIV